MKFTNVFLAASAASLACAYPHGRDVIPNKRSVSKRANGFTWFGVSESGAEFGEGNVPGTLDTDYTWPEASKITVLRNAGMNVFRVPFLMERLVPDGLTGSLDSTYLKALKSTVATITDSGAYAVLDPHNYGRYSGNIISSTDNFKAWWKTVATEFASNEKVIFDTNNEYHDMDQSLVLNLNQAAINGIRAAGAKTQYIFVEGNAYSGAWSWTDNNDNLKDLTDPQDKIVYEMHQYLDSDSSGTSETCVSSTIGKERLTSATEWLKNNNKKGFLGEFAGGVNSDCETAVKGMLSYMSDNSDVWMGASWWSAGPWWGTYMYSLEPTDGPAYSTYLPILKEYFVSSSGSTSTSTTTSATTAAASTSTSSSSTSSTTSSTVEATSTPSTQVQVSSPPTESSSSLDSSSAASVSPIATEAPSPSTIPVNVPSAGPTTIASTPSPVHSPSSSPSGTSAPAASGVAVAKYYQCGGDNWTGGTSCATGLTCVVQNKFYHQCL